jgi:hypothetical protein
MVKTESDSGRGAASAERPFREPHGQSRATNMRFAYLSALDGFRLQNSEQSVAVYSMQLVDLQKGHEWTMANEQEED